MTIKVIYSFIFCFYFINCKKHNQNKKQEIINITAESSLRNLLPEITEHFNYKYPKVKVNINFKPEILCKKDIFNSTIDLVINYGLLNNIEKKNLKNQFGYEFPTNILAFDALILLSNNKNLINSLSKAELKEIILKKFNGQKILLEDLYPNAAFYFLSNHLKISELNSFNQFNGIENLNKMIGKLSNQNNLIGFTSSLNLNTIKDLKNIKLIKVKNEKSNLFILPSKENILNQSYPLLRPIFYTLKHNYETPATWFVNFLNNEKGQLIFKRNGAIPNQKKLEIRKININY